MGADKLGLLHTVRCIKLPLAAFTSFILLFFPAGLGGMSVLAGKSRLTHWTFENGYRFLKRKRLQKCSLRNISC